MILMRQNFWIAEGKYGLVLEGEEIDHHMIKVPQQSITSFVTVNDLSDLIFGCKTTKNKREFCKHLTNLTKVIWTNQRCAKVFKS